MEFEYKTRGVCSQMIRFELEGNTVHHLEFVGGCHGNSQGIAALVEGMDADEVIRRTAGIRCGWKPTSCPDQLSHALREALAREGR